MAELVPAIHVFPCAKTLTPGTRPGITPEMRETSLDDGRFGKRQLLARAPLVGDVVDDERDTHPLDRALFEAVIGVVRRNEDHRGVRGEGQAAKMPLVAVVDVGTKLVVAWVLGEVKQQGEGLDAEISVGLEPEAIDVLSELDAEIGAIEIGAEHLLDVARGMLVLEGLRHRLAHREARAVLDVEIFARVVMQLALARNSVEGRRLKWESHDIVDGIRGKAVPDQPVTIRLLEPFARINAFDEAANDVVRRTLPRRSSRTLDRNAFPHDAA